MRSEDLPEFGTRHATHQNLDVMLVFVAWIGWYSADSCRARLDDACGIHSTVLT
jgi:hypothetical protein